MPPSLNTPVVLILFNRPVQTRQVFRAIATARPEKLLVIADGPRKERPSDESLCSRARAVVNEVDWPCEVSTNFSTTNLGCSERVVSGLNWAFAQVPEAIILEDDCVPDQSFFPFCQELLDRYRGDSRIGMVSGNSFVARHRTDQYSYRFSRSFHIWGWATWREAWHRYDRHLQHWQSVRRDLVLREICSSEDEATYWTQIFDSMYERSGPDTWDYQWVYTLIINNMLSIVPSVNLVRNIGFGPDATHTHAPDSTLARFAASRVRFPLKHPPCVVPLRSSDEIDYQVRFKTSLSRKMRNKLLPAFRRIKRATMGRSSNAPDVRTAR